MNKRKRGPLSITRIGAGGRLTIPAEYRRALSLSGDAAVALVPMGDALVIVPCDDAFSAVGQRLEARMRAAGSDVEELISAAAEARMQIVREEFGRGGEE